MKIRHEIYDENGLVKVEFIEVEEQQHEELILQKEQEILIMYQELELLKEKYKK